MSHDEATRAASRDRLLRVMIAAHFNTAFNRNHTPESLTGAQVLYNEPRFGPLADAILAEPLALSRPSADVTEIARELAAKAYVSRQGDVEQMIAAELTASEARGRAQALKEIAHGQHPEWEDRALRAEAALTARDARAKPSEDVREIVRKIVANPVYIPAHAKAWLAKEITAAIDTERAHGDARAAQRIRELEEQREISINENLAQRARATPSEDIESTARGITGDEDHEPLSALGHIIVAALQRERAHGDARAADAVAELAAWDQFVLWLNGEEGSFPERPDGKGIYYWRTEMLKRAADIRRVPR